MDYNHYLCFDLSSTLSVLILLTDQFDENVGFLFMEVYFPLILFNWWSLYLFFM